MDNALFLLAFAALWETLHAMQCYRCLPQPVNEHRNTPLCETFDYSSKFIMDCPHSTGCIKKSTQLLSLGVTTETVERDCAHQTMDGYQEKDSNGQWKPIDKIHEVYNEGCKQDSSEYDKPTRATHCFCRGDLCNSAVTLTSTVLAVSVALWVLMTLS